MWYSTDPSDYTEREREEEKREAYERMRREEEWYAQQEAEQAQMDEYYSSLCEQALKRNLLHNEAMKVFDVSDNLWKDCGFAELEEAIAAFDEDKRDNLASIIILAHLAI